MKYLIHYWQMIFSFMMAHPISSVFMSPFLFVLIIVPFALVLEPIELIFKFLSIFNGSRK